MSKVATDKGHEKDPLSPMTKAVLALIQGLLPAMTAIIGGIWIVITYLAQQHDTQITTATRAQHEADTRRVEAQRPFLEKQLALYFEAAQVAGRLVAMTPDERNEWESIEKRFRALYWSELSMVEDKNVEEAMVTFSRHLYDYTSNRKILKEFGQPLNEIDKKRALSGASLELAHAIRKSIESAWAGRNLKTEESARK